MHKGDGKIPLNVQGAERGMQQNWEPTKAGQAIPSVLDYVLCPGLSSRIESASLLFLVCVCYEREMLSGGATSYFSSFTECLKQDQNLSFNKKSQGKVLVEFFLLPA